MMKNHISKFLCLGIIVLFIGIGIYPAFAVDDKISDKTVRDLNELLQSYIPGLENAEIKVKKHKINLTKVLNVENKQTNMIGSNLGYKNFTQILYDSLWFTQIRYFIITFCVNLRKNDFVHKLSSIL